MRWSRYLEGVLERLYFEGLRAHWKPWCLSGSQFGVMGLILGGLWVHREAFLCLWMSFASIGKPFCASGCLLRCFRGALELFWLIYDDFFRSRTLTSIWFFLCNPQIHMFSNYIGYLKLYDAKGGWRGWQGHFDEGGGGTPCKTRPWTRHRPICCVFAKETLYGTWFLTNSRSSSAKCLAFCIESQALCIMTRI